MTPNRQRLTVALVCGGVGAVLGTAIGVLVGGFTPDVIVVFVAFLVLAVWSVAAGYVGWLAALHSALHNESDRFDGALDAALELHREGQQIELAEALAAQRARIEADLAGDTDALIEATKEDQR